MTEEVRKERIALKMTRPILGITMGDVCGCGPEITVKALMKQETYDRCRPLIVGSVPMVYRAMKAVGAALSVNVVTEPEKGLYRLGTVDVYDVPLEETEEPIPYGKVTRIGGESAYSAVSQAIKLAMSNKIDGTITGPLNKEALNLAGHHYNGHTELYADHTGTKDYAMMLADGNLRVIHVSTHVSLRDACDLVKKERVHKVIQIAHQACLDLGIEMPKIAVAGLNPHSGENGMFGTEEIEEITPAIKQARAEGLNVEGPIPPDTVFSKARGGMYDVVVAMYHDQGHIPLKVVGFVYSEEKQQWNSVTGVNITLGLPIIRVSVDHGTAFGKAGKGTASAISLENAIGYGARMAIVRKKRIADQEIR